MRQIIKGKVPSKSNCYEIIRLRGVSSLGKADTLKTYERNFFLQCNHYRNKRIKGLFKLVLNVYYPSNRSDLDNSLKIILDCLQQCGAIENDNKCVSIVAEKFIDKVDPRIEFEITEI